MYSAPRKALTDIQDISRVILDRRTFLAAIAAAPALGAGFRAKADAEAGDATVLAFLAQAELARVGPVIARQDVVGVADFSRPSREPRLHLVDMTSGAVSSYLVAHGRGSDPERSGWVQVFSNEVNSECSSRGAFLTADYYVGRHGRSMRLVGLDPTNSNAEAREIVVHSAPYVCPRVVLETGVLGRSEGCFAVDEADIATVLTRLGPGRLLISTKL
jgi:hypothetical protein